MMKRESPKEISFIPQEPFTQSLQHYEGNNFVKFLFQLYSPETVKKLIEKYFMGTSKHWLGATIFWQIDIAGKIRTGKIMLYDSNGKRVQEPNSHIAWAHTLMGIENYKQCFYGENLVNDKTKPIAIFESEKTAVIASIYFPELLCIAAGGADGLQAEKFNSLRGRKIILYPDLNKYEKWNERAKELSKLFPDIEFHVSDVLQRRATQEEIKQGLDWADYLIRLDFNESREQHLQSDKEYEMTYADKIGKMLLGLQTEEIIYCPEENRERFIETVKSYIDREFGWRENPPFEITFSNDFTRIKKEQRCFSLN
ncbi:MAG: hypothetical protein HY063_09415 [Bacteroidetes bacterium]|nr:hypothetical protein [Bacteroidota bacterium]